MLAVGPTQRRSKIVERGSALNPGNAAIVVPFLAWRGALIRLLAPAGLSLLVACAGDTAPGPGTSVATPPPTSQTTDDADSPSAPPLAAAPTTARTHSAKAAADAIEQLQALHDRGGITDVDYERRKDEILRGM